DLVRDAGRELALDRLRRLAPHQHALDEQLGRRFRDPTQRGLPYAGSHGHARAPVGLGGLRALLHGGMLHRPVAERDGFLHDVGSKPQSNVRRTSAKSAAWGTSWWVLRANGWATRVSACPCAPSSTRPRLKRYSTKRRASCSGGGAVREPRPSAAEATSNRRTSPGASTTSARPSRPNWSALSESRRVWVSVDPPASVAPRGCRARVAVPGPGTTLAACSDRIPRRTRALFSASRYWPRKRTASDSMRCAATWLRESATMGAAGIASTSSR